MKSWEKQALHSREPKITGNEYYVILELCSKYSFKQIKIYIQLVQFILSH